MPTDEELAVIGLRAWNDVPADYPFEWPKDFPEGSRAAWRRVVTAIRDASPSSNGRTPHFDCGNEGSSPSGESIRRLTEYVELAGTDQMALVDTDSLRVALALIQGWPTGTDATEKP